MAKYFSSCPNQVLTMTPTRIIVNQGIVETVQGKRIIFENSNYETTNKDEIKFLKSHRLFGFQVVEVDEKESTGAGE